MRGEQCGTLVHSISNLRELMPRSEWKTAPPSPSLFATHLYLPRYSDALAQAASSRCQLAIHSRVGQLRGSPFGRQRARVSSRNVSSSA